MSLFRPWSLAQKTFNRFTEEELDVALAKGKKGKAVGTDGTSHELLLAITTVPGGKQALLGFYNEVFRTSQVPDDWNSALMVVIPKEIAPTHPTGLRPLAMGSATAKVYSRLLMQRSTSLLQNIGPSQCSGKGRQTSEDLFTMARVMQLEAEWHRGLVVAKIDITKAFDMLDKKKLLSKLQDLLGTGFVYRSWHALLSDNNAILQTSWGQSTLQMDRGIKQGSVESPSFFSYISEHILETTKERFQWHSRSKAFDQLTLEEVLYMDDGLLWSNDAKQLQQKLQEWASVMQEFGLSLNAKKCKVYYSPHYKGLKQVKVNSVELAEVPVMEVMGMPFRVGAPASELIAPVLSKAREKFWASKHLLRASTPLKERIRLLDKILSGTALWCLAALAPDAGGLALINSTQYQLVIWCMKLGKRKDESWLSFKQRAYRSARQVVWNGLGIRWSSKWLQRWWDFAGHRARGIAYPQQGAATILDYYRTRQWWLHEQAKPCTGIRHPKHYPRLSNMEKDMDCAAGAKPWREVARDRVQWQQCRERWILHMDVPWTGGRQACIRD